jgi:hypothetical protein
MSRMNLARPTGFDKLKSLKDALQSVPVEIASSIASHGPDAANKINSRLQQIFPRLSGRLVVTFKEETSSYNISVLGGGAMDSISGEVNQVVIGEIEKLNEEIAENIRELVLRGME